MYFKHLLLFYLNKWLVAFFDETINLDGIILYLISFYRLFMACIVIVSLFGSALFVDGFINSPYLPSATLLLMPALLNGSAILTSI